MKISKLIFVFLIAIVHIKCSKATESANESAAASLAYKMVWNEEFDNNGLPSAAKWDYEEGLVRNNEKQFYTRNRTENARIENGNLIIEARKENFSGAAYTSASITTKDKASWKYGKFEIRAKLPAGSGSWPAIWMLGNEFPNLTPWPKCGEIDIMEAVGKEPGMVYATVHYGNLWPDAKNKGGNIYNGSTYSDFHVYSVEWTADSMKFFIDKNNYFTFNKADLLPGYQYPFDKPFYLLLNLAVGGSWGGGNAAFPPFGIDDSSMPQKFIIDYVRIYQKS